MDALIVVAILTGLLAATKGETHASVPDEKTHHVQPCDGRCEEGLLSTGSNPPTYRDLTLPYEPPTGKASESAFKAPCGG